MGRAQQGMSGVASFAKIFPGSRGAYRDTDLDAPKPTAEAHKHVERLLRRDFHDYASLRSVLDELQLLEPHSNSPLAEQVKIGVAEHYNLLVSNKWKGSFAQLAKSARIRSIHESFMLVTKMANKTVHIWPDGDDVFEPCAEGKTLCNLQFRLGPRYSNGWQRAKRGSFLHPGLYGYNVKACSRCTRLLEKEPEAYPEAHEPSDSDIFLLWPETQRRLEINLQDAMQEGLSLALQNGITRDQEELYKEMMEVGKRIYLDALVDELFARQKHVLQNGVHYYSLKDEYEKAFPLETYPITDAVTVPSSSVLFIERVASLLTRDDWMNLMRPVVEDEDFSTMWRGKIMNDWDKRVVELVNQKLAAIIAIK